MKHRRRRIVSPVVWVATALLVVAIAYVVGLATYQASQSTLLQPGDLYVPRLIDVVLVSWCFWVGSSIGSFLNVVAWRMPRGESINGRSHCPRCHAQLRARDNFPVFGWLALRGRCRTCHLPISVRYPIVECLVGLTITLVAVAELYRLNLPRQDLHWHGGPFWAPIVDYRVLLVLLYHTVGLATCWAFGLVRLDHHRLPNRLITFALLVTIVPMLAYPTVMVVPWQTEVAINWRPDGLFLDAPIRVITALAAAVLVARYLGQWLCPSADPKLDPLGKSTARLIDLVAILSVASILVGWQAFMAVTVCASLIAAGSRNLFHPGADALGRLAIAMPMALTGQLLLWRRLHPTGPDFETSPLAWLWPSDGSSPEVILGWAALLLLVPLWLRDDPPAEPAPELLDRPGP